MAALSAKQGEAVFEVAADEDALAAEAAVPTNDCDV
jgi:hypothetical protein